MKSSRTFASWLLRFALGFILVYFGINAITHPGLQAALWINPAISGIIKALMPITVFMVIFGALQVIVGVLAFVGVWKRYVLPVVILMLVGIIVNLGWNEVSIRDFVILSAVIYLYTHEVSLKK